MKLQYRITIKHIRRDGAESSSEWIETNKDKMKILTKVNQLYLGSYIKVEVEEFGTPLNKNINPIDHCPLNLKLINTLHADPNPDLESSKLEYKCPECQQQNLWLQCIIGGKVWCKNCGALFEVIK